MKKRFLLVFTLYFYLVFSMPAQSNAVLDSLLEEEKATWGKCSYLVLSAAGIIPEDASEEDAMRTIMERGWQRREKATDEPIKLGRYSFLIMQAFDLKGGIMYTIFRSPRYASRELGFKGFIRGDSGAYRTLTGEEAVRILGRVLEWKGASR
ncbi:MAG: hypothetical protein DRP87_11260 [Spirochaetes bacterium]|nr:MAG: hypothetical protein DRP87_11260 [Spirochaetota bacterium]